MSTDGVCRCLVCVLTSGADCGTKMTESVVSSVLVRLWKKATSRKGPIPIRGASKFRPETHWDPLQQHDDDQFNRTDAHCDKHMVQVHYSHI